jgi:hypothetical protein
VKRLLPKKLFRKQNASQISKVRDVVQVLVDRAIIGLAVLIIAVLVDPIIVVPSIALQNIMARDRRAVAKIAASLIWSAGWIN